jgi:hypothetical protein
MIFDNSKNHNVSYDKKERILIFLTVMNSSVSTQVGDLCERAEIDTGW